MLSFVQYDPELLLLIIVKDVKNYKNLSSLIQKNFAFLSISLIDVETIWRTFYPVGVLSIFLTQLIASLENLDYEELIARMICCFLVLYSIYLKILSAFPLVFAKVEILSPVNILRISSCLIS